MRNVENVATLTLVHAVHAFTHQQTLILVDIDKVYCTLIHTLTNTRADTQKSDELSRAEHSDATNIGSGVVKGDSSPSLSSAHSKKEQLPFFSGIPSVEVVKGLLHLYKPKLVTTTIIYIYTVFMLIECKLKK